MSEIYKCDKCGKEFDSYNKLSGHMTGAHKLKDWNKKYRMRKERVPVGIRRQKLTANIRDGKVGRWVNDDPGRLQMFLDGGYEFETDSSATDSSDEAGTRISKVVDRKTGKKAYLMTIDKDFYEEDQAAKQAEVDEIDERIKRGKIKNQLGDRGYSTDADGNPMIKYEPR